MDVTLPELWAMIIGQATLTLEEASWAVMGLVIMGRLLLALVIVALGRLATALLGRMLDRIVRHDDDDSPYMPASRASTLRSLLGSVVTYGVNFVVLLTILDMVLGIDTTAILAGAGILGLAVGFGAQNLVRDVISGFFILYENQIAIGDHVVVEGIEGTVDSLGLRITTIRDFDGSYHYVANGDIKMVQNYSRGDVRLVVDVPVAYEEDVAAAVDAIQRACDHVAAARDDITQGPQVLGVHEFGASEVVLRVDLWASSMNQWQAGRDLRAEIKQTLDDAGIEIPYARQVLVPPEQTSLAQPLKVTGAGDRGAAHGDDGDGSGDGDSTASRGRGDSQ